MKEILSIIERETKGKCFRSQKYSIDTEKVSTIDYTEEKEIVVDKSGETEKQQGYIDLRKLVKDISKNKPLFKFFLDGSRRVYKIDDIAYDQKVYPIITGQIGVGFPLGRSYDENTARFYFSVNSDLDRLIPLRNPEKL